MIDANALLRRWISTGLSTQRISAVVLPAYNTATGDGFRPIDGPWVVLNTIAGTAEMENPKLEAHIQLRVWAGPAEGLPTSAASSNQTIVARTFYLQVADLIHGQTASFDVDGRIVCCEEVLHGQDEVDAETGYASVRGVFKLTCINN